MPLPKKLKISNYLPYGKVDLSGKEFHRAGYFSPQASGLLNWRNPEGAGNAPPGVPRQDAVYHRALA